MENLLFLICIMDIFLLYEFCKWRFLKSQNRVGSFYNCGCMAAFTDLGNYQFVTIDDNQKVGSVYFEHGRIRLVHPAGPCIELHKDLETPMMTAAKRPVDEKFEVRRYIMLAGDSVVMDDIKSVLKNKSLLLEQFISISTDGDSLLLGDHISRGYPYNSRKVLSRLVDSLETMFNLIDGKNYQKKQKIFEDGYRQLLDWEINDNDLNSYIPQLSFYEAVRDVSFDVYKVCKDLIHDPTEYGFKKK